MKKLGLVISAAAVLMFLAGCTDKAPATTSTSGQVVHGKLGTMPASRDRMK